MTNLSKRILSAAILFNIACGLIGIRWGLPGETRARYALPASQATPEFFDAMKRARDDIYSLSGGSPLGRTATAGARWVSSIEMTLGMQAGAAFTQFAASTATAANFARPFMLRSNSTDEQMTISSLAGMKPGRFQFDPKMYQYGTLYIYGIGGLLYSASKLGLLMLSPDITAYFQDPSRMARLFLAGRAVNIPFSGGIVFLSFLIARKAFSERAGIAAAVLCAVSPQLIFQAHIMKPYCVASFFALASIWYALSIPDSAARGPALKAGAAAGLAMACMPLYGVVAAAYAAACVQNGAAQRRLAAAIIAQVIVFAACSPYFFIHIHAALSEAVSTGNMYSFGLALTAPVKAFAFNWLPHQPIIAGLCICAGWVYAGASLRPAALTILAGSIVPTTVFIWLIKDIEISFHISRFFVPWSIAGLILFAGLIDRLMIRARALALAVFTAAALHTAAFSAVVSANFSADAGPRSTRIQAARWLAERVDPRSTLGVIYLPEPAHMPAVDFLSHPLVLWRDLSSPNLPAADYALIRDDETDGKSLVFLAPYTPAAHFAPVSGPAWLGLSPAVTHVNSAITIYRRSGGQERG